MPETKSIRTTKKLPEDILERLEAVVLASLRDVRRTLEQENARRPKARR